MRFTPKARCSGANAMSVTMVVQLGLAMMPLCFATSTAFISGTTNGTLLSMRKVLELSITTAPALVAAGANCLLVPPPALKSAMSIPSKESSVSS